MKRSLVATLTLLGLMLLPLAASAATIKAYIADFTFTPAGSADLKGPLKTLLVSRLSGDGIATVESAGEADVVISGSYTQLGKFFSLDTVAKSGAGKVIGAAFEQGEAPDGVIPSVGKVAAKLRDEIRKNATPLATATPAALPAAVAAPVAGEPIRMTWISQRVVGAQNTVALAASDRLLTANGKTVRLYSKEATLKQLAEVEVAPQQKIVGIDAFGGRDGASYAFVSIVQSEAAASRIYLVEPKGLRLVADNVPYLFRTVATFGGADKLYAQQLTRGDYYGDVYEATYDGKSDVAVKNPIKMPRYANIFNFNLFRDKGGKQYLAAFSDSGYLIVYSDQGEELWRSDDKFGGSEEYFMRHDAESERFFSNPTAPRFIDQRISVTDSGDVLVPQNGGFFVVGNSRSYSKYSLVALTWNGAALEEHWRSKLTSNYLADYFFDPASRELTLLELAQREGVFGKGASLVKVMHLELP